MKIIKIFSLPSHQTKTRTSGVDFTRIIQPSKHLNGYSDGEVEFKVNIYDIQEKNPLDWLQVAQTHDIIFFNYLNNPWGYAALGAMARGHGVKIVLDMDDALWQLKSDNPAYETYQKGSQEIFNFTRICEDVDLITTTNDYLKHVIMNNTQKKPEHITVVDNLIDLDLYNFTPPFKDDGTINLVHHGSTTHFNDLLEPNFVKGIDKIMSEFPNVTLQFVGAFIPRYRERWGSRYTNSYGHPDIYKWINGKYREYMLGADIMITPLTEDIYNRAKSGIKFLENSAAGKPGVYQNMGQYRKYVEPGVNGYLASTDSDWYQAIKSMVLDTKLRQKIGQQAFKTVQDHTIQKNVNQYAQLFKKLVED